MAIIQCYPYDFQYKYKNGIVYVILYAKTTKDELITIEQPYTPYFYVSLKNVSLPPLIEFIKTINLDNKPEPARVLKWEETEKSLLGISQPFLKVYTNYPRAIPLIAKEITNKGYTCHERDILFIHRYLRDLQLTPMTLTEIEGTFIKDQSTYRTPLFRATSVKPLSKETAPFWKIIAVDIETYAKKKEIDMKSNPILMLSFYGIDQSGKEFRKVLTWKSFTTNEPYIEFVKDEKTLLEHFKQHLLDYNPDIITGYFTDGFDFPYIKTRADLHHVKLDLGKDYSDLDPGKLTNARDSETKIAGLLHIDIFKFVKNIFGKDLKIESLSLDSVAAELIGHKKHVVDLDKLAHTWDNEPEKLEHYCAYNLHDSILTHKLTTKLLPDIIEFTRTIGVPLFDLIRMRFSRLVESYILKRAIEYNEIAPNKPDDQELSERMDESVEGAFVYQPTPGIYKDIVVFDFRSLYPSIISAHNIGPESLQCTCCKNLPHVPEQPNYWFCQKQRKFIPTVLDELLTLRTQQKKLLQEAKKRNEDVSLLQARVYSLKVLANSFYGYLGFYGARWYSIECAASTTAYARNYIKQTIQQAEQHNFKVIYADTDSCFILLQEQPFTKALEFMDHINKSLPGKMELECDGQYTRGIFVAIKGTEKGAKKKYALITAEGKMKITGFETVRRNWSQFAKEVQQHVLKLILIDKVEEAFQEIKKTTKDLIAGQIPLNKLIIKTQITRDLSSYTSIGPHILIAQKLAARGEKITPGTLISYILVKGTGLIRDRAKLPEEVKEGEYDADYYLHHQLLPAVAPLFAVLGYSEDDIFKESSQKGLGQFL